MSNTFTSVEILAITDRELEKSKEEPGSIISFFKNLDWPYLAIAMAFMMSVYSFVVTIYNDHEIDRIRPLIWETDRATQKLYNDLHLERERLNSEIGGR